MCAYFCREILVEAMAGLNERIRNLDVFSRQVAVFFTPPLCFRCVQVLLSEFQRRASATAEQIIARMIVELETVIVVFCTGCF